MPIPNSLEKRLKDAKKRFDEESKRLLKTRDLEGKELKALYATQAADEDLRDERNREPYRLFEVKTGKILGSIYDLVLSTSRDATLQEDDFRVFIEKAFDAEKYILSKYYAKDDDCISHLSATYGRVVKDETMPQFGMGIVQSLASLFANFGGKQGMTKDTMLDALKSTLGHGLKKWGETYKPSTGTTPLSRFSKEIPTYLNPSPPLIAFTEAKAEITDYRITNPIVMKKAGNALALLGCSGWKERDPDLEILDVSSRDVFLNNLSIPVGLSGVASYLHLDSTHVFVADNSRIKSYSYSFEDGSLPIHTFDSTGYGSSIWTMANAPRFVRSGRKGIAVWDLSNAPTHGEDGEEIVGEAMSEPDTWRDNDDGEVELSTGTKPTQIVDAPALAEIDIWANHPTNADHLIVAKASTSPVSTVYTVSLESQQLAMRYLGHGARVTKIATNKDDTSAFLTSAEDGAVRFYDMRTPVPTFTIEHHPEDRLGDVLYVHIDGHPFVILGGDETQQVKVWDIRARQPLYELSTGNNDVRSLVWDDERQTLYANTTCRYMTRMGDHMDYRKARFSAEAPQGMDVDDEDYNDEDDFEDEDDDEERGWPERAYHQEHSFGHPLDSGEHRLYKYSFKVDADIQVLPAYGDAGWGNGEDYW